MDQKDIKINFAQWDALIRALQGIQKELATINRNHR